MHILRLQVHASLSARPSQTRDDQHDRSLSAHRPRVKRNRWQMIRLLVMCLFITVVLSGSAFFVQALVVDHVQSDGFAQMTFDQWAILFQTATDALRLPQLFLSGPRVRAKLFLSSDLTLSELLSAELLCRQRISEIVDVNVNRVFLEYLETTVQSETSRGSWATTVGISALIDPPSLLPNATRLELSIDRERRRLLDRLLYGGIVHGANVTISSLHLFGTPMRLLHAELDGEGFYQLDAKPWISVSLVVASESALSRVANSTAVVTASATSASSAGAIQNLRLRLLIARLLRPLQIDSSSILVREAISLPHTSTYGVDAVVIPIELHVGTNTTIRRALDGYLRNASLASELKIIAPQWELLAVEVDQRADELLGNATADAEPTHQPLLDAATHFDIALSVHNLEVAHVQRRRAAILDAIKSRLSHTLGIDTFQLTIDRVVLLDSASGSLLADDASVSPFVNDGDDDGGEATNTRPQPIDRAFQLRITATYSGVATVMAGQLFDAINAVTSTDDVRVALGFLDAPERASGLASVGIGGITDLLSTDSSSSSTAIGSSYVDVTILLRASDSILSTPLDAIARYQVRCALLLVLEDAFVENADLFETGVTLETSPNMVDAAYAKLRYRVRLTDPSQRVAIARAVSSWELSTALADYTGGSLTDIDRWVDVNAGGAQANAVVLPGTTSRHERQLSARTSPTPIDNEALVYDFRRPTRGQNPSRLDGTATTACPSLESIRIATAAKFYACLRFPWASAVATSSVFLRCIVAPMDALLDSTVITMPLPVVANRTKLVSPMVPSPWVPGVSDPTDEWAFQVFTNASRATVRFVFDQMDAEGLTYPAFHLVATVELAELARVDATTARITSLRRDVATLQAPSYATTQPDIVTNERDTLVTSSVVQSLPSAATRAAITLAPDAVFGILQRSQVTTEWTENQPQCAACLSIVDACSRSEECTSISRCLRRMVDARVSLFEELLQANHSFDMTELLHQCLSSPPSTGASWSSAGRTAFATTLLCISKSSCGVRATADSKRLVLQYAPRTHTIRANGFPLSLTVQFDINGGNAESHYGTTVQETLSIASTSEQDIASLQTSLQSLYGAWARGMWIQASTGHDPDSGSVIVRIEYNFMDEGVVEMPFLSLGSTSPVASIESNGSESLLLVPIVLPDQGR